MFTREPLFASARTAHLLERMYHQGQASAWDGKEVLRDLVARHGAPCLSDEMRRALGRIFAIIMWGELAAWRIGAELAEALEPLEAKLAATSQAFDEARHFYVMRDYLEAQGALPPRLDWAIERLLEGVMNAPSLAARLAGMQLLVEPVALTLFQIVRELSIEPVLSGLLPYYERDEARHVALGVHYLPCLLCEMSASERAALWAHQSMLLGLVALGAHPLNKDLALLGADPRQATQLAGSRILHLLDLVQQKTPGDVFVPRKLFERLGTLFVEVIAPEQGSSPGQRTANLWDAALGRRVVRPEAFVQLAPQERDREA
jgi:hypothetical protein